MRATHHPMNYEIKVIDCKAVGLEAALNKPASEGWQLVSCWPDGQNVRAVFQRETRTATAASVTRAAANALPTAPVVVPTPAPPHSAPPTPIPADDKFLDAVIAACNAQPPKTKDGKPLPPGIGLARLGKTWGMTAEQARAKLENLGVKEKGDKTSKDHSHSGFYIWLHGNFVNIREAKRKSPTRA